MERIEEMAWIRLETGLTRDASVVMLSSDEVRWAYVAILCAAKEFEGKFSSRSHLAACVSATVASHVDELLASGLIVSEEDAVLVPAWDKYQKAFDPNAATRMREYRDRKKVTEEPGKDKTDRQKALDYFTENGLARPTGYVLTDFGDMLKGYGLEALIAALDAARADGAKTTKAIVSTAESTLRRKTIRRVAKIPGVDGGAYE